MAGILTDTTGPECCCDPPRCDACPLILSIAVSGSMTVFGGNVFDPECGNNTPFSAVLTLASQPPDSCIWDNGDDAGVQGYQVSQSADSQFALLCNSPGVSCVTPFISLSLSPLSFVMWVATTFIPTGERVVQFLIPESDGPEIVDDCPVSSSFDVGGSSSGGFRCASGNLANFGLASVTITI